MHNVVAFLSVVSLLCAGQAHAQSKVDVYTFSDASCQVPLTSVFFSQPQQLYLSPANSPTTCVSAPCILETHHAIYGPLILGFSATEETPTNCRGRDMFKLNYLMRQPDDGSLALLQQYGLDAGACTKTLKYAQNASIYFVVVPSFCPKPSLCTTCTENRENYYGPSPTSSNGFCDVGHNYTIYSDFKYCSDRIWYKYYRGDCINGSKPLALPMSEVSCYTSCSACLTFPWLTWRSTVSSNPGTSGVCTTGNAYLQNSTISSYPYYFNQDSGCSSAFVKTVSASSVTNPKMLSPLFQLFAAAYLFCVLQSF
jgi:hypothetical protein